MHCGVLGTNRSDGCLGDTNTSGKNVPAHLAGNDDVAQYVGIWLVGGFHHLSSANVDPSGARSPLLRA